jgi:hypothetical protein
MASDVSNLKSTATFKRFLDFAEGQPPPTFGWIFEYFDREISGLRQISRISGLFPFIQLSKHKQTKLNAQY